MKQVYVAMMTLLAGASLLTACSGKQAKQEVATERIENVRVAPLATSTIGQELEYATNLQAVEAVNVVPVSPGRIDRILVEVGSRVQKGQVLVHMDQTSLLQAKINLTNLENDFKRYEALKETGAISQQTYDQLQAQLSVQRTNIAYLESNTQIKAPFAGIVAVKNYENGEMYTGALPILTVMQLHQLKAFINMPESYYPLVKKGLKVTLTSDTYQGQSFQASVYNVAPTVNPSTRTFEVELRVSNAGEKLKPGMFTRAQISLGQTSAVVVPYQSVLKTQGSNERYVFVEKDGKAKRYTVTLGQRFDDQVEIRCDSIVEGDKLVVAGQARLVDGVKLNVVE
ncbi:MAG TPA: efflux transporter periplasmic adaptor subunit [Bacteroidales bacterium]|nr:efflux transporter periplasmic adaptor subunit [Bacteroidales bacterium]